MTAPRSILLIANPTSGKGRGARLVAAVAQSLRDRGLTVSIEETHRSGEARTIAEQASRRMSRADTIVACGGDGTVQEVANALALRRIEVGDDCPTMGLAPGGRCNDFARVLGIHSDPNEIAEVLAAGTTRPIDLGRINDQYFCTVATVGVDADISDYVNDMHVPLRGTIAYLYGTLRVVPRYSGRALKLTGDFGTIEQPVFVASTANTSSYGGAIRIAPQAVPDDGMLDLCLIDHVRGWRTLSLLRRVVMGKHEGEREVRFIRTREFTIESANGDSTKLWADGEPIANTPVTVRVAPAALRVIVPADASPHQVVDPNGGEVRGP